MTAFTEEQTLIAETARQFSAERLAPFAAERDRAGEMPMDALAEMGALGLLGMPVPEQYGGAGADMVSYALTIRELAKGDGGISTCMGVQTLVENVIIGFGSDEQKDRWLPEMASGDAIGAFMLTEPHTGSDAGAITCKAKRDGNGYVLNGTKQFITSGQIAKVAIVFAVTDAQAGARGISAFVVPTGGDGYRVAGIEKKMGQRTSDTAQIVFDDFEVTGDCLLGAEGEGYKIALANLESGRIGIAAQALGFAEAAFETARVYANERTSFGKPIIDHQAVGHRLADMATQLEAARHLVFNAARLKDAGTPCLTEASMAKLFASEMAERVCSDALQTLGGYGYLEDFPVERLCRDARVTKIYEGTSDVQRLVIARSLKED